MLEDNIGFAKAKELPWNTLGEKVGGKMTAEEVIEKAQLDFEVVKEQATVSFNDEIMDIPDTYATIRKDNSLILGTVGAKYTILQNKEAFKFFDPIIDDGEAIYETAGLIEGGKRVFITAKLPEHISILGNDDLMDLYLFITNSHDGKSAITIAFTPIRITCNNTLNAALKKCVNKVTIKHTENLLVKLNAAHEAMGLSNQYKKEISEIFYKMANTKASEQEYEEIIVKGLADNSTQVKNYFNKRAKVSTRFTNTINAIMEYAYTHHSQNVPSSKDTIFGAYNALTGFYQNKYDWGKDNDDAKLRSLLDSNGRAYLKQQQAFDAALKFIK